MRPTYSRRIWNSTDYNHSQDRFQHRVVRTHISVVDLVVLCAFDDAVDVLDGTRHVRGNAANGNRVRSRLVLGTQQLASVLAQLDGKRRVVTDNTTRTFIPALQQHKY